MYFIDKLAVYDSFLLEITKEIKKRIDNQSEMIECVKKFHVLNGLSRSNGRA